MVVLALVSTAVAGYRLGLLARACSWIGLFAGLVLTTRNMDTILRAVGDPRRGDQALAMAVALFLGSWAGKGIGMAVGRAVHRRLPGWTLPHVDRAAGGALGAVGIAALVWLVVPLLAVVPGWPARQARTSLVARLVHDHAPRPPAALTGLRAYLEAGAIPSVLGGLRSAPALGDAPSESQTGATLGETERSVVRVEAVACRRILEGSGFVVGGGEVLTNAHVVAGASTVDVIDADGNRRKAFIEAFDASTDAALLRVDLTVGGALQFADAKVGQNASVVGHPHGGPVRVVSAAVRDVVVATGRDLYDRRPASRSILVLAARLVPGDSGAPVLNGSGEVIGMAFAIAPDRRGTAYALDRSELDRFLAARPGGSATAGRCIG